MLTGLSALNQLADVINQIPKPVVDHWQVVDAVLKDWAANPGPRRELRAHLRAMPADEVAEVVARSKETTTHFAWCLYDQPGDEFSLWLHEYKPQRSWLPGYANSVHNHRYHFCTTLVSGGYLHERYTADVTPDGRSIRSVTLSGGTYLPEGAGGCLLSHEFHRIPLADDGTMTFLVKSRMVEPWSLSFDPATGLSQRHLPLTSRLTALAGRL